MLSIAKPVLPCTNRDSRPSSRPVSLAIWYRLLGPAVIASRNCSLTVLVGFDLMHSILRILEQWSSVNARILLAGDGTRGPTQGPSSTETGRSSEAQLCSCDGTCSRQCTSRDFTAGLPTYVTRDHGVPHQVLRGDSPIHASRFLTKFGIDASIPSDGWGTDWSNPRWPGAWGGHIGFG